jgi:polyphosphate kinase
VIHFLREASIDPKVKAIKITLYRVARNSNIVNALINAAKNGKQVTVAVELTARFDEEANLYWTNRMEEEGIKVIHGLPDLKIHSKICIVTREEKKGKPINYVNIGTGNFHEGTAKSYCDHSLFTADKNITAEVAQVFEFIEHHKKPGGLKHLMVSPFNFRQKISALIQNEIKHAKAGKDAWIIMKVNHIVDDKIIELLYNASNAGVKIDIIARTTCSIIPGIAGMSENIRIISIIDKYLEHARAYVFCHGGNTKLYLGSADLMPRNLDRRLEVTFPIFDKEIQAEVLEMIHIQLRDNTKARIINEAQDNQYKKDNSNTHIRAQVEIYNYLKNNSV